MLEKKYYIRSKDIKNTRRNGVLGKKTNNTYNLIL